jgi:hypothetical protein
VEGEKGRFERERISPLGDSFQSRPAPGGIFVAGGPKPGQMVVVTGAETLLSSEQKGPGGDAD